MPMHKGQLGLMMGLFQNMPGSEVQLSAQDCSALWHGFSHQVVWCRACELCQSWVGVVQSAVAVVTEVQQRLSQKDQEQQHMRHCLQAEKQQLGQQVGQALAQKDAACEERIQQVQAQAQALAQR